MIVSWIVIDELHIATFATHPGFRRQGVGSQLLKDALDDASRAGARRAFLEVRASNAAAQEMYRKFGFEVVGRRPRYYRDNSEDAVLMTLEHMDTQ
jgi:ribosomal-protein-alanine N-acetyltransferase